MRLDKYLCQGTDLSRAEAKKWILRRRVTVNGVEVPDPKFKVKETDEVAWMDQVIGLTGTRYIMLHKPLDFICSNQSEDYPTILNLIDIPKVENLRIAGRLDVDTTGLVLLSEDGQWIHRITSPKKSCGKLYRVWLLDPIDEAAIGQFEKGVELRGDGKTQPARLEIIGEKECLLEITEGKYHQVKRMFGAIGNKVVGLKREQIGALQLDESLEEGEWRFLTDDESALF